MPGDRRLNKVETALVLVNPIAGRGNRDLVLPDIEKVFRRLGVTAEIILLPEPASAGALIKEKAHACSTVVAAGGDGTAGLVAGALLSAGSDKVLGLLPLGFGNCLARSMGIPGDIESAAGVIAAGYSRNIDVGLAADRPVLAFLSAGWDAEVIRELEKIRQGPSRYLDYLRAGWDTLQDYAWPRFTVEVDGQRVEGECCHVIFSQWPIYAKFMSLGKPEGLRAYLFRDPPSRGFLRYQLRLMPGLNLARAADIAVKVTRSLKITASGPAPYQIDGDFGGHLPLDLRVMPGGLEVLCPQSLNPAPDKR